MLSKRLRYIRKIRKLSQGELGKKINTTKSTISNYENEYSTPSNEVLKDLSIALNCTTDFLLGLSEHPSLDEYMTQEEKSKKIMEILNSMSPEKRVELEKRVLAYTNESVDANKEG